MQSAITSKTEIKEIVLHPVYDQYYSCSEHWFGQFQGLGDALGVDCVIQKLETKNGRTWLRAYHGEGLKNEDWYGWHQNVLAPIDGIVDKINENTNVNEPGIMGTGKASFIIINSKNGFSIILAHVDSLKVNVGDSVQAGDVIGLVGNNGQSRHPHIHIGAWKDQEAFQIRFDQTKIKGL